MSDATILSIVGSLLAFFGTLAGLGFTYMNSRLASIKRVSDETHSLVNSSMEVQLSMHMTTSRQLSNITKDPEDIKAADAARSRYMEHVKRQALMQVDTAPIAVKVVATEVKP